MPENLVAKLEDLIATEPPFIHLAKPRHHDRYLALFDGNGAVEPEFGLIYELPHSHRYQSNAHLISNDSEEGRNLILFWAVDGGP
ncbi:MULTISPECIES: hypothetical protein [Ochrobactrum]|uniref:Uncharacterized protein n=1 Tax=Ochrobactrum quorumnocens TaxID=271865 RepID=A0A5N1JZI8_9HYPH|nr:MULTISPECIES: hypothetical protein [Brucella/Ochrobactrum group]KAA9368669.1 hypothetical protein F3W84_10005 [[Ochrobactrum] quorumnocens]MBD7989706.1 hypothetical protein [Ochrobactrum gallinarum]